MGGAKGGESMILKSLREALMRLLESELERRHRAGYELHPVEPGEFSDWEDEQVWGD